MQRGWRQEGGAPEARALVADRLVESLDPLADDDVRASWVAEAIRRRDDGGHDS